MKRKVIRTFVGAKPIALEPRPPAAGQGGADSGRRKSFLDFGTRARGANQGPPGVRELARWLAFVAVYVFAAKIETRVPFVAGRVTPLWPLSGFALWAALKLGTRMWPAVWIAAALANIATGVPFVAASAIAIGSTLEAIAGARLLRAAEVDELLDHLHQVVSLILVAAVCAMIGATAGVTGVCVSGLQPWGRFGSLWWTWWLGDATGDLLVVAVLLTVPLWRRAKLWYGGATELAALEGIALALSTLIFAVRLPSRTTQLPLGYTIFPLMMWAGLRFAHAGAALAGATVSCIAIWGTFQGAGPFGAGAGYSPQESSILVEIYTAVTMMSGLVFGAVIAERNRAERLREADHALTSILSQGLDLKSAARPILKAVCDTLLWDVGILWQVDDRQQTLEYVDSWQRATGVDEFVADSRERRFQRGIGLPGRVWATAQPAWIANVVSDPNFPRSPVAARLGLHGGLAFPILVGQSVAGVIEFFVRKSGPVDGPLLALMAAAGSQIGQFIDRTRAHQRVVEGKALTSAIIDVALDCVITIDADGKIVEFNPAAARTFGVRREDVLGRELAEVVVPPGLRGKHRDALRRCVQTGEARILGQRLELAALRADGTEFPVELAVTRVVGGERPVFTAHVRDITDRKRIEQERVELLARERAARVQAEAANRSKDEFLATVSHELRTPLTAILGWASMLQTHRFDAGRLAQIYERIHRSAQAQTQIVDDLLDVSRIVNGLLRLELRRTDICDVARLGVDTIRPTARAKGVTIAADIPQSGCIVSGDPARLQQVLWNLLSNAVKFTRSGTTVALVVRRSDSRVTIEVRDRGIGIPPAFLPRVFERFWQADGTSTRVHGGLGLGLALVRHIVELHGGEVEARSAGEGHGSTFVITLPAEVADARPEEPSRPFPVDGPDRMHSLDAVTVLIVDDDFEARELFTAILESEGARVICAGSAAEGLKQFEDHQADVMVLDIGMPEEDGFSLLKRVRAHEALRHSPPVPAIAVTAYAGPADHDAALGAGFAAHLPKPVLPEEIISAIQRTVSRRTN